MLLVACGGSGGGDDDQPSSDANLISLLVEDGVLTPAFASSVTQYTADVAGGTTETRITAVLSDSSARLTIDGAAASSNIPSDPITLPVGTTNVDVVVTARDGTTRTYRVAIVRPVPNNDAELDDLALSAGPLDQLTFDPAIADYSASVGYLANTTRVIATPADPNANSVAVDGEAKAPGVPSQPVALAEGIDATRISVVVTAEDAVTQAEYRVDVTRGDFASVAQTDYVKATNTSLGDLFGSAVTLRNDRLLTGAPFERSRATGIDGLQTDNSGNGNGAVYLYERLAGTWNVGHYIKASNTNDGDRFGTTVAATRDFFAVGAPGEQSLSGSQSDNSGTSVGAVYVFDADLAGAPSQTDYLKASNADNRDNFGDALAADEDRLLVGARFEQSNATGVNGNGADNSLNSAGAAYLFEGNGSGAYTQVAYLKASNSAVSTAPEFGNAVALSGDTLAVAAWREDSGATGINGNQNDTSLPNAGAVYVFEETAGVWAQTAYLKASNTGQDHNFGAAIALDEDTLVVGAPGENTGQQNSGAVYVFVRDDLGTWSQQALLKANVVGLGDLFGISVALVGDMLAVGAIGERSDATGINGNDNNQSAVSSGAAYLFERDATGTWSQIAFLKASNTDPNDLFGFAVALDGDTLAVGASNEQSSATGLNGNQFSNANNEAGAAYLFQYWIMFQWIIQYVTWIIQCNALFIDVC
ncbi:MAG: cadherin-like beta sandwich domain-containing protein, partial [Pseudomonadota bacterium]